MVASWEPSDFLFFLPRTQQEQLQDSFLEVDIDEVNRSQRLILVAEEFDYSVLIGAEWLSERHNVDIICCKLSLAKDSPTGAEFLVCSNIFPAPEIVQQAVRRRLRGTSPSKPKWSNWDAALSDVANQAVASFVKSELAARDGNDCNLRKRLLRYRIAGKRRWNLSARRQTANVWQHGRFDGDVAFWRSGVSHPDLVKEVKDGLCLSLSLSTENDFRFFRDAVTNGLVNKTWTSLTEDVSPDADNDEPLS
jgi:hypothetical protein